MYEILSMKHKLSINSWAFDLDDVHFSAYWENAFTKEECIKIVKSIKKPPLIKVGVSHHLK